MDTNEAQIIIEEVIQGIYNRWIPKDFELKIWYAELRKYDYARSRKAISELFFRINTRTIDPPAGKIVDALREYASIYHPEPETVMTGFYIECTEAPERNPRLIGAKKGVFADDINRQNDPDYMLRASDTMRSKYEQLYGGKWIVIQDEPEGEGTVFGPEAKLKAEVDILTGPDCKAKRWLEAHKEKLFKYGDLLKSVAPIDVNSRRNEQRKGLLKK